MEIRDPYTPNLYPEPRPKNRPSPFISISCFRTDVPLFTLLNDDLASPHLAHLNPPADQDEQSLIRTRSFVHANLGGLNSFLSMH